MIFLKQRLFNKGWIQNASGYFLENIMLRGAF